MTNSIHKGINAFKWRDATLHHDHHKAGPLFRLAPSACARPPYEFTKLALSLLRHGGVEMKIQKWCLIVALRPW